MGYTLSVTTGYGVEIDEGAWRTIEERWLRTHGEGAYEFEDDRYWHLEQVLAEWPGLEVEVAGFMGEDDGYAIVSKNTVSRTYGVGIESLASQWVAPKDKFELLDAAVALEINNAAEWLVIINYG